MKGTLWSKPSLMRDFAVLSALIVFVLILVSLWVTYVTFLDRSRYTVHQLETEATRIDRQMIIKIEHASYLLESLGRQISQMDTQDLHSVATLLRSFDTDVTLHNVLSWIDDKQLNIVSSNSGVHAKGVDVSDRDFVKMAAADHWKIKIGSPIQGRVSGKWALPVALGVTDKTGKHLGLIALSMDIEVIRHDLESMLKDTGIAFAIFSADNQMITQSASDAVGALEVNFGDKLKSINFNQNPSGIIQTGNLFDKFTTHIYYEMSARYPYTIVLGLDNRVNVSSVREMLIPRLLQIVLLGLFMMTLLWIVRLHVIKPVVELTHSSADVLRGKPFRLLSGGAGEVQALAQEIKYLADYVEELRRIEQDKDSKNLQLHKARENAERSNSIKTEFLTAMSHGLRTPLNTIIGFSEIIKNQLYGPLENTQYWQYAQDIHESAQHLQALIDDVLQLSNAEIGVSEWEEKPIDVAATLAKCLRLISERLQEHKLQVEIKTPESLPRLLIDENRLKQLLVNLFLHARKADERSHILVEAYIDKMHSSDETFAIAFTAYLPTLPVAKNRGQEAGTIGLPLTKALAAMHQATLEASKVPGKSSTITLRFPQERIVY